MRLRDYLRLGWEQLRRRMVVTALCAMGIAIGSASIIVAISFGESINHYSKAQLSYYMKSDEITVSKGNPTGPDTKDTNAAKAYEVTKAKIDIMRTLPHVKALATYQNLNQFRFEVDNKRGFLNDLVATELDTLEAFGSEYQQGGASASDMDNTIVLSYGATMGLFDEQLSRARSQQSREGNGELDDSWRTQRIIPYPVYQKQIVLKPQVFTNQGVEVTNIQFPLRVVGILKKPEGVPDEMVANMKTAYVSPALGKKMRAAIKEANSSKKTEKNQSKTESEYNEIKIKVDSSSNVRQVDELVKKLKLSTQTNLHREERMQGEMVILRMVFGGVGLFILFVASISIIVAMTMSTYQRRRQIGIMKVLGANLRQIRNMFMVESALLGLIGGGCGILLSYWVIWGINIVVNTFSPPRPGAGQDLLFISTWILPVGLFFAVMTGVLSGIYPAIKASRTDALTAIKRD